VNETLRKIPFIRLVIPLILGIVVANFVLVKPFIIAFVGLICFVVFVLFNNKNSYSRSWIIGAFISMFFCCLGYFLANRSLDSNSQISDLSDNAIVVVEIKDYPVEKRNSYKLIAKTRYAVETDTLFFQEDVILYVQKDSSINCIGPGTIIVFRNKLDEIKNKGNPGEFDLKRYYQLENICFSGYLRTGDYLITNYTVDSFIYKLNRFRRKVIDFFYAKGITGDNHAVLSALTLGYKELLSKEVKVIFASAGMIHVLAVSGLHVGIIFLILAWVFKYPLRPTPVLIQVIVILLILWTYAAITGFSPSVRRATIMFSFFTFGRSLKRNFNSYNLIAASAFLILLFEPTALFKVGFQLSYAAVLAILVFQKPVFNLFYFKNRVLVYFWRIASVSIAAQIGTLPLTLFYFHQFPSYFIISNIILLPLIPFLIYGTVVFVIVGQVESIAQVMAFALKQMLSFVNFITNFIDSLPGALIENITISKGQVLFLYFVIIFLAIYILFKQTRYLVLLLVSFFCVLLLGNFNFFNKAKDDNLVVYNSGKESLYAINTGNNSCLLVSGDNHYIKSGLDYYISTFNNPEIFNMKSDSIKHSAFFYVNGFLLYNGKRILFLNDDKYKKKCINKLLGLDLLIVSKEFSGNLSELMELFNIKKVVFDSSVKGWRLNKMKAECENLKLSYYAVDSQGAYIFEPVKK